MAKIKKLPALRKRELLHATDVPRDSLLAFGELYLEEGYLYEAMEFFEKAREPSGLDRVRDAAVADGDVGLLEWIDRNGLSELSPQVWRAAAENATKAGSYRFAARAFEKAGDDKRATEAREATAASASEGKNSRPSDKEE